MASVFEKVTRVVGQEMDAGGDTIAVRSIMDADRLHCLSLVKKRFIPMLALQDRLCLVGHSGERRG